MIVLGRRIIAQHAVVMKASCRAMAGASSGSASSSTGSGAGLSEAEGSDHASSAVDTALPSIEEVEASATAATDWRSFAVGSRVGESDTREKDHIQVRMQLPMEAMAGLGKSLALPATFAEHTWDPDEDPLHRIGLGFDPSCVSYSGQLRLSRAEREIARYRPASLNAPIAELGLPEVAEKWLREILGSRLDWKTGMLRITCRRHASPAENRREAFEQLAAACRRARELADTLGDFTQRAPIDKDWGRGQQRKRRRRKANPERPPFTLSTAVRTDRQPKGPPLEQLMRLRDARMAGRPYGEDIAQTVLANTQSDVIDTADDSKKQD